MMTGMTLGGVRVLGPVEAWSDDDVRLDLGQERLRTILAILAMRANTPVGAETLIHELWADDAPKTARSLVHTYMSRLRRALDPGTVAWSRQGALTGTAGGYVLALSDGALDVDVFRAKADEAERCKADGQRQRAYDALTQALSLWRGQPFGGLSSSWLDTERQWLEERRLVAHQHRLALDLEFGRQLDVIPELMELASVHPMQESVRELLMLALYRSGRRSEALDTYMDIQGCLRDELGIEPGVALQDLFVRVLRSDPSLDLQAEDIATTSPAPATLRIVPAQLPRDVSGYSGRESTIETVVRHLSNGQDGVAICAIAGRPGVGKTALAVHVGHQVRSRFPDGQIFINLAGARPAPAEPGEALDAIIRAIVPEAGDLPDQLDQRAALLRSVTAERRLLIVLDDARSAAQVEPLLPAGPGCAVIVSSRTPLLGLQGARHVRLESLSRAEAAQMLRSTIGDDACDREPAAMASILEACAGLPLAIQIVASKLATRPHWQLPAAAGCLQDEARRLENLTLPDRAIRVSVGMSVDQLAALERRAFAVLSVPNLQSLDLGSATALLGVSRDAALPLVEALVDGQLLDVTGYDPAEGLQVGYHDLTRLVARELADRELDPAWREAALGRLIEHFSAMASVADLAMPTTSDAILPAPDAAADDTGTTRHIADHPMDWLDREAPRIIALVQQALRLVSRHRPWRLLDSLLAYTLTRSRWELWDSVATTALDDARRREDALGQAVILRAIGRIELERSDGRDGGPELAAAYELFVRLGDERGQIRTLKDMGFAAIQAGSPDLATVHLDAAIALAERTDDRIVLADATAERAKAAFWSKDIGLGLRLAFDAKRRYTELDKPGEIAAVNLVLGRCYERVGESQKAIALLHESLNIVERIENIRGQACILRDLGMLDTSDPAHDRQAYLERSLVLCRQLHARRIEGQVLYGLGRLYEGRSATGRARDYYDQAWRLIRSHGGAQFYDEIAAAASRTAS
jgi:DNA-binding SARP family transcriptional activator/tetratricopeptide (TPR) repeat protein